MQLHYVTFAFTGISDPQTGDYLEGDKASAQFYEDFEAATRHTPESVVGIKIVRTHVSEKIKFAIVRFIVEDGMTEADLCEIVQTHVFDEGGLDGDFYMGGRTPFSVERQRKEIDTVVVWARDSAEANDLAHASPFTLCVNHITPIA